MKFEYATSRPNLQGGRRGAREDGRGRCRSQRRADGQVPGGEELTEDEIINALRSAPRHRDRADVCGSAFKNKGVQAMLDGVIDCCRRRSTCRRQGRGRRREG
jgi:hypothetical protein